MVVCFAAFHVAVLEAVVWFINESHQLFPFIVQSS